MSGSSSGIAGLLIQVSLRNLHEVASFGAALAIQAYAASSRLLLPQLGLSQQHHQQYLCLQNNSPFEQVEVNNGQLPRLLPSNQQQNLCVWPCNFIEAPQRACCQLLHQPGGIAGHRQSGTFWAAAFQQMQGFSKTKCLHSCIQQRSIHSMNPSREPVLDHDLHRRIQQINTLYSNGNSSSTSPGEGSGTSSTAAMRSSYGSADDDDSNEVLHGERLDTDTPSGGLRLRYRRRIPMFQVIEFYASGAAMEVYKERSPQELGLHPRDVTLFAPLSRLAAPQRATIAVHDGKILVKTEVVKAIITADKAVLIKGRRQKDTQKLAQQILQANDQRLMEIRLHRQQLEQAQETSPLGSGQLGSCERAATAADLLGHTSAKHRTTPIHSSTAVQRHAAAVQHRVFAVQPTQSRTGLGVGQYCVKDDVLQPAGVAAAAGGAEPVSRSGGGELKDVPFEMLVLEILLDATAEYFYTKVQHLNWMLESIAADIRQPSQPQGAMDKAHQLIPIQKFMTRVKNDVRETCEAIQSALEDDETLEELCLSWHVQQKQHTVWMPVELQRHKAGAAEQPSALNGTTAAANGLPPATENVPSVGPAQQVRMLTEMLESYEREIQSLEGSINEAEEDLENTRSIWHMQLDSSRNHIIMVNLWLSMLNISVMATTILPAFFGMNLHSGLSENDPFYFYMICGSSVVLSALSYPVSRYWYNRNWRRMSENELFEQKMLRVLLVQNIEDVDEIVKALQQKRHAHLDRKSFRQLVLDTLGSRAMPPSQIDFLYQCYDRNRDGFLAEAELIRPLNTYHNSTGSSSGSSGSSETAAGGFAALDYGQQPRGMVPTQLGSLNGFSTQQQQGSGAQDETGNRNGQSLFGRHAVRMSPRQRQQQRKQQRQEQSWEDDERLNWDWKD